MEPMTHLRENCLENQIDNLDSQLTDVCTLRTRLEALEEWGWDMADVLENYPLIKSGRKVRDLLTQARALGLVEE